MNWKDRLLSSTENLLGNLEEILPWLLIPILVTNAEIKIFKKGMSIASVVEAKDIDALCESVPYLRFYNPPSPSFERHCKNTFRGIPFEQSSKDSITLKS